MRARDLVLVTAAGFAALGLQTANRGAMLDWALFEDGCTDIAADASFACADYGVFYFGEIDNQGSCSPLAEGSEPERLYPRPLDPWQIPLDPGVPVEPREEGLEGPHSFEGQTPNTPVELSPWLAVVDWDDPHGLSVGALADTLSGPQIESRLFPLDDPGLNGLGDNVGDQHVLAQLCAVAEQSAAAGADEPLLAVNMSFGRLAEEGDATDALSCDEESLSCQIARVLESLWLAGATPVAAAGNHKAPIFPGSLAETVAAGAIDVQSFLELGTAEPLWETPSEADALLPAQALCVDGAVVAAGSSYSSAFFSGWYSLLAFEELVGDGVGGSWAPAWSPSEGCYVLGSGGELFGGCNPHLEQVFAGIARGASSGCWTEIGAGGGTLIDSAPPGEPQAEPTIPSLDSWVAENRPAPESDPCIPCVGDGTAVFTESAGSDLVVNLSASEAIDPSDAILDEVLLRIEDRFYPLGLDEAEIAALQDGVAGGLRLTGYLPLLPLDEQASLVYLFKVTADVECRDHGPNSERCFWSSTPVLMLD